MTIENLPSKDLYHLILKTLEDQKAEDIVTIDLSDKESFADAMIVASSLSARHCSALADYVIEALKNYGMKSVPTEGMETCNWILIDAGDIVVHIFREEVRQYYQLEKLWEESPEALRHQIDDVDFPNAEKS